MAKDPYKLLGVDRKADEKTIRSAYRKLAKKYHPDVNSGEAAAEKFKEITACLLYTSPSPRDGLLSRMPSSA